MVICVMAIGIALTGIMVAPNVYAIEAEYSNSTRNILFTANSVWETGNGIDITSLTCTKEENPVKDVFAELHLVGANLTRSGMSDEEGLIDIHFPVILDKKIIVNMTQMTYLGCLNIDCAGSSTVIFNDTVMFDLSSNFLSENKSGQWIEANISVTSLCKEINFRDLKLRSVLAPHNESIAIDSDIIDWPHTLKAREDIRGSMRILFIPKNVFSGSYKIIMALLCGEKVLAERVYEIDIKQFLKFDLKVRDEYGKGVAMVNVVVNGIMNESRLNSIEERTDSSGSASFILEPSIYVFKFFMGSREICKETIDVEHDLTYVMNLELAAPTRESRQQMTLSAIISMISSVAILSLKRWRDFRVKTSIKD